MIYESFCPTFMTLVIYQRSFFMMSCLDFMTLYNKWTKCVAYVWATEEAYSEGYNARKMRTEILTAIHAK